MQKVFELSNKNGISVSFSELGGRIISIKLPQGNSFVDIIAGAADSDVYLTQDEYAGAICGRYANRIANAKFDIDGKMYELSANEGNNQLHGGLDGFHKQKWRVEDAQLEGFAGAYELHYISKDLEEGYPGELWISVIYALNEFDEFFIQFSATAAKTTIINLTNHCYFNLAGGGTIRDHYLQILADKFTPFNHLKIPTGELMSLEKHPLDFRNPLLLGDFLDKNKTGLDHNFVLHAFDDLIFPSVILSYPAKGRSIEISTTQPGVQIYTAYHFHAGMRDKAGNPMQPFSGIAIEPQNFPNAPNIAHFPSAVLLPGQSYQQTIRYSFKYKR
jgi:aldose 1-epimerase